MTVTRPRRLAAAVLATVLLGGCGVGLQDTAEPLPSGAIRTVVPAPSASSSARETAICFVNGRKLEKVPEPIPSHAPDAVMRALAAGPPAERGEGLRTLLLDPLSQAPVLVFSKVTSAGEAVVMHEDTYLDLSADDQMLLMGQVTCSMASVGLDRVLLIDPSGQPAQPPRPDGRVQGGPVTLQDYASLLPDE